MKQYVGKAGIFVPLPLLVLGVVVLLLSSNCLIGQVSSEVAEPEPEPAGAPPPPPPPQDDTDDGGPPVKPVPLSWQPMKVNASAAPAGGGPEMKSVSSIANGVAKLIGGGLNMARNAGVFLRGLGQMAKYFGIGPSEKSFIVDNHAGCRVWVRCASIYLNTGEFELEKPDGIIVKFYTNWQFPDTFTYFTCYVRSESGKKSQFVAYGFDKNIAYKPTLGFYGLEDGRITRLQEVKPLPCSWLDKRGCGKQPGPDPQWVAGSAC